MVDYLVVTVEFSCALDMRSKSAVAVASLRLAACMSLPEQHFHIINIRYSVPSCSKRGSILSFLVASCLLTMNFCDCSWNIGCNVVVYTFACVSDRCAYICINKKKNFMQNKVRKNKHIFGWKLTDTVKTFTYFPDDSYYGMVICNTRL